MAFVIALIPSIGVGLLFYVAIRSIVRADRNERRALERLDATRNVGANMAGEDQPSSVDHSETDVD